MTNAMGSVEEEFGVNNVNVFLKPFHPSDMAGPTPWCNWVVPHQVIAGAYPCCLEDNENDALLSNLVLTLGMETFVCLQV